MGLGGDYKTLGRQKCLAEFVNTANTDNDAEIEIELSNSNTAGENESQTVRSAISYSGRKGGSIRYQK